MWIQFIFFFFFQAEDGIRDVERSRGLGDVYKRQGINAEYMGTLAQFELCSDKKIAKIITDVGIIVKKDDFFKKLLEKPTEIGVNLKKISTLYKDTSITLSLIHI
eukprot:TRINITY_DN3481_c0_g1_i2.p2 TRINITY_DN3481_c0_g1~~TRINITY_DN3481_c0_g1_i2.p2  ORF type:complete len:105 (-),score=47.72 TRINITY_DN3481_c0_g1_i2:183-497(-)